MNKKVLFSGEKTVQK